MKLANTNPEVERWFAEQEQHPLESIMRGVREVILGADKRMSEIVQYGTVQFVYKSPLGGFVQVKNKKQVTLMFNAAGRLIGDFPRLEGKSVKYMYFSHATDVEERAAELRDIVGAWIAYKGA
jgi:hypothetical protein